MAMAAKRKRDAQDMPDSRPAPSMSAAGSDLPTYEIGNLENTFGSADPNMEFSSIINHNAGDEQDSSSHHHGADHNNPNASSTAAAAMAQFHTMTVPQSTESAFMKEVTDSAGDRALGDEHRDSSFGNFQLDNNSNRDHQAHPSDDMSPPTRSDGSKPAVGSDEWHKIRRDNHKEVERRRRETINEGINELAKIVPGCEKNKGSILQRAVQFITQLKDNETQNIEKWTLEKLLTEQAIAELSSSCDKLKADNQRAWAECEKWKRAAEAAGRTSIDGDDEKPSSAIDGSLS